MFYFETNKIKLSKYKKKYCKVFEIIPEFRMLKAVEQGWIFKIISQKIKGTCERKGLFKEITETLSSHLHFFKHGNPYWKMRTI